MKNTQHDRNWIWRMRLAAASAALAFAAVLVLAVLATQSAQAQVFTVLASFDGTNGVSPAAGLVQATNGKFYGTSQPLFLWKNIKQREEFTFCSE